MKNLYRFEIKKICNTPIFKFIIPILLVVVLGILWLDFGNSQMATGTKFSKREAIQYNQKIAKKFEGHLDDDKIKQVLNDYLLFYTENKKSPEKLTSYPMDVFSYYIADTMLSNQNNLPSLVAKNPNISIENVPIRPLSRLYHDTKQVKKFKLTTYYSWSDLFKTITSIFIPIALVSIIVIAGIFSEEKNQRIDGLILTTKYGRSKLTINKIAVSYSLSFMIFISVFSSVLLVFWYLYGFSGWEGNIRANFYLKFFNFPILITNLQVLLLILFIQLLNILVITSTTLVLSTLTSSANVTMIASVAVTILPKGLDKLLPKGTLFSKIIQYFPANNFTLKNIFEHMSFNESYLFNHFWSNLGTLVLLSILSCAFSVYFVYFYQKRSYLS